MTEKFLGNLATLFSSSLKSEKVTWVYLTLWCSERRPCRFL